MDWEMQNIIHYIYIMQTIIHRMDKQGLTVLHREQLYSISVINHTGKENEKRMSKGFRQGADSTLCLSESIYWR